MKKVLIINLATALLIVTFGVWSGACATPPEKKEEKTEKKQEKQEKKEETTVRRREASIDVGAANRAVVAKLNEKLGDVIVGGFKPWKDILTADQLKSLKLEKLAIVREVVNNAPSGYTIEIAGHCNPNPSQNEEYYLKLSQRRAKSVLNYLVANGLKADKFTMRGAGTSETIDSLHWSKTKNRRVTFKILIQ